MSNKTNNSDVKRASTSFKTTMKNHKQKLALQELSGGGSQNIVQPAVTGHKSPPFNKFSNLAEAPPINLQNVGSICNNESAHSR